MAAPLHIMKSSLYDGIGALPVQDESFSTILEHSALRMERIVSFGQSSPADFWYDQTEDEWVMLFQGEARLDIHGAGMIDMKAGDYILLPAGFRHRVDYTSQDPPCIWLALHGNLSS